MNGRDLLLKRSYFTYNHIPTVKLSSAIVGANDKHMIVLHGLFGNKSTFRYLANNEKVILCCLPFSDKIKTNFSFAGRKESWGFRKSYQA